MTPLFSVSITPLWLETQIWIQSWSIGVYFISGLHDWKFSNTRLQWRISWAFIDIFNMLLNYTRWSISDKNCGSHFYNLSAWAFIFLSQSFWWSEKPCLPLLKELGPADVGVSLKKKKKSVNNQLFKAPNRDMLHDQVNWITICETYQLKYSNWIFQRMCPVYTCQCSSFSSLPLEAFLQVHSAWQVKVFLNVSVYIDVNKITTIMQLCACVLTSSSSLKTDASPGFLGGTDGTGSLGF